MEKPIAIIIMFKVLCLSLQCPLSIFTAQDTQWLGSVAKAFETEMPNAKCIKIDHAGHFSNITPANQYNKIIW